MKRSLVLLLIFLGPCGQAGAQVQDVEERERTRREMREVMRSERERWRESAPPVSGWAWRPPSPRHWEGQEGRLTPSERRELRNLLDETARERRALAAERGPELVPTSKGTER
ncbi:MAG: hypothetical protein EBR45_03830 [Betaproteobacteria bacterium]|jgi:hypothetical protein|nr:hypothetical protein [Betaproteobacteria bacterium]